MKPATIPPVRAWMLNRRATLRDRTHAQNAGGEWIEAFADTANDVPYMRSAAGMRDMEMGQAHGVSVTHVCIFQPSVSIARGQLIVDEEDGLEIEVLNVETPTVASYLEVRAREREFGG